MKKDSEIGKKLFKEAKAKLLLQLKRLKYLEKKGQRFVLHKVRRKHLFNTLLMAMKGFLMTLGKVNNNASEDEIIDKLYEIDVTLGQYFASTRSRLFKEEEDFDLTYSSLNIYIHYYEKALAILDIIEKKYLRTVRDTSSPEPTH